MLATRYRKYLLSHHLPKDYKRCIKLKIHGKIYLICSRCFGLYIGSLISLILFLLFQNVLYNINFILYLFPLPAVIDWGMHKFNIYQGTNISRITTGLLLGTAFAGLFYTFIKNPLDLSFWVVVIGYSTIGMLIFKLAN